MIPSLLTIDDVRRETGLTTRTIRYYSSRGILSPLKQPGAGNRLYYSSSDVARLQAIRSASWNLADKREAKVVHYHIGQAEFAADLVREALVDGAMVMELSDGTVIIKRPVTVHEEESQ